MNQNQNQRNNKKHFQLDPEFIEKTNREFNYDDTPYRNYRPAPTNSPKRKQPVRGTAVKVSKKRKPVRPTPTQEYYDDEVNMRSSPKIKKNKRPGKTKVKRHIFIRIALWILILCILVLIFDFFILFSKGYIWFNEPRKIDYPIRGPVITEEMGSIEWEHFSQQNIQMAYIRATKSSSYIDERFKTNWSSSKGTGIYTGALHVFDLSADGESQAKNFCKAIGKNLKGRLLPAVEVKLSGFYTAFPPSDENVVSKLTEFVNYIKNQYGVSPVIYCNSRTYKKYIKDNFPDCPLWYESLYSEPDKDVSWQFWGYTNRVRISYYENHSVNLYMTILNGNKDKIKDYICK